MKLKKNIDSILFTIGAGEIVNTAVVKVMETKATIVCTLSCFSEEIGCKLLSVSLRKRETIIKLTNTTVHTSNITGDSYSYSYRSQNITVTNLTSGNKYILCVHAYNLTTTQQLGDNVCENFTTIRHHSGGILCNMYVLFTYFK